MRVLSRVQLFGRRYGGELVKAFQFGVSGWKNIVGVVSVSIASFVVFVGVSFPRYTFEMVRAGYLMEAFSSLLWLMGESSGLLGVGLVIVYSIVTGVLVLVVVGNIRYQSKGSGGVLSVLPAMVFSGCASCGAGLLGVIGAFGFASVLPFEGNLIRLVGIVLVLGVLAWIGDPRECRL